MRPSGALMIEHRLIEKILPVIANRMSGSVKGQGMDPVFVDAVVDFFRIYADRTHHGKEEDILFIAIRKKKLTEELLKSMEELINDHIYARKIVGAVVEANNKFRAGDKNALEDIIKNLKILAGFYPGHIEKEDKVFFPEVMKYFDKQEQEAMLNDFWEFDRKMIHEKYQKVIDSLQV